MGRKPPAGKRKRREGEKNPKKPAERDWSDIDAAVEEQARTIKSMIGGELKKFERQLKGGVAKIKDGPQFRKKLLAMADLEIARSAAIISARAAKIPEEKILGLVNLMVKAKEAEKAKNANDVLHYGARIDRMLMEECGFSQKWERAFADGYRKLQDQLMKRIVELQGQMDANK